MQANGARMNVTLSSGRGDRTNHFNISKLSRAANRFAVIARELAVAAKEHENLGEDGRLRRVKNIQLSW